MGSVLCPTIFIAAEGATPALTRFLTAVRRKSCGILPGTPAFLLTPSITWLKVTSRDTSLVIISASNAILNFDVWLETVTQCGDGSGCLKPDSAPVCKAINSGEFIPGADLISTFDPSSKAAVIDILGGQKPLVCPKAPYAACMTAPCTQKKGEKPVCSCPVFNGVFQLPTPGAVCDPGDNLIPSASFTPADIPPP